MSSDAPFQREHTRILFVPADLLGPEIGESFLDRESLSVRSVTSWAEALAVSDAWAPHLVVFRSEFEDEAAPRFCQRVLAETRKPRPKLLMVTDRVRPERVLAAADAACDAHLVSPISIDQLLETIAELIDLKQRRFDRVPLDVLVHTEGFAEENAAVDSTLSTGISVSEEGMMIEASRQLAIGVSGRLQFFLPDTSERLALDARVRVAVDEIRLLYMVEFTDLAPQHRTLIRRYVESRSEAA